MTLGQTLLSQRFSLETVEIDQRLACGQELIELGDRSGLGVLSCVGRQQLWWCDRELGDRDEMNRWYEAAEEWVHGPDIEQISQAATVALIDGDLERAERITDQIDDKWHASIVRNLYLVPLRLGIATCRGGRRATSTSSSTSTVQGRPTTRLSWSSRCWRSASPAAAGSQRRSSCLIEPAGTASRRCTPGGQGRLRSAIGPRPPPSSRTPPPGQRRRTTRTACRPTRRLLHLFDRHRRPAPRPIRLTSGNPAGAHELAANAVAASRRRRTPIFLARRCRPRRRKATLERRRRRDRGRHRRSTAIGRRTGARIIAQDVALFLAEPIGASHHSDQLGFTHTSARSSTTSPQEPPTHRSLTCSASPPQPARTPRAHL